MANIYIRRRDNSPIEWSEILDLTVNDPDLEVKDTMQVDIPSGKRLDVKGKYLLIRYADTYLVYNNGELSCSDAADNSLGKIHDIAAKLDGIVET